VDVLLVPRPLAFVGPEWAKLEWASFRDRPDEAEIFGRAMTAKAGHGAWVPASPELTAAMASSTVPVMVRTLVS
jgi:hypothetical protein